LRSGPGPVDATYDSASGASCGLTVTSVDNTAHTGGIVGSFDGMVSNGTGNSRHVVAQLNITNVGF
jgi:hypothetical protein